MPPSSSTPRQHGVKGVYYGGHWLDIENCDGVFTNVEEKCSGCQFKKKCAEKSGTKVAGADKHTAPPRSRTSFVAGTKVKSNDGESSILEYDVCIIGAGCIGAAIARELSRYQLRTLWVEAADDVSQGATKGNSGIVHAGYDDKPNTNRAKYCWKGNQMFPQLDKELRFGYQLNGSLVLATSEKEREILKDLLERGKTNGVQNLRIVERDELFEMEPFLNENVIAALYSPDAGNVIPYEFTIALAENAVDNGVELRIRREVVSLEHKPDLDYMEVTMDYWEPKKYLGPGKGKGAAGIDVTKIGVVGGVLAVGAYTLGDKYGVEPTMLLLAVGLFIALLMVVLVLMGQGEGHTKPATPLKDLVEQLDAKTVQGVGGTKVDVDDMKVGGSGSSEIVKGEKVATEKIRAKYVINCAGSASDKIAEMVGETSAFKIKPRLGDYLLLNRNQGHLARHTLFPCPDPVLGKGVLVQTTLWGNLILGPTARDMHKQEARDMSSTEVQKYILSKCQQLVPSFDAKETIHAFCGARAKSSRGDWIIEPSSNEKIGHKLIHVAGIDSPGLAGSPAIALEVVRLLQEGGCSLAKDPSFNPERAPIITPKGAGMKGLKVGPVGKVESNGTNEYVMASNVICKCEKVTELEVVRALRRSLPIDSTQAIRKRTRAGMGHCQGDPTNYHCEARVKAIIARETGLPLSKVGGRPWPATSTLSQRWIDDEEKETLEQLQKTST